MQIKGIWKSFWWTWTYACNSSQGERHAVMSVPMWSSSSSKVWEARILHVLWNSRVHNEREAYRASASSLRYSRFLIDMEAASCKTNHFSKTTLMPLQALIRNIRENGSLAKKAGFRKRSWKSSEVWTDEQREKVRVWRNNGLLGELKKTQYNCYEWEAHSFKRETCSQKDNHAETSRNIVEKMGLSADKSDNWRFHTAVSDERRFTVFSATTESIRIVQMMKKISYLKYLTKLARCREAAQSHSDQHWWGFYDVLQAVWYDGYNYLRSAV